VGFKPTSSASYQSHSGIIANDLSTAILVLQPVGAGIKWLVVGAEGKN
jgi:hypothetical protein